MSKREALIVSPLRLWERVRVRGSSRSIQHCRRNAGNAALHPSPQPSPARGEGVRARAFTYQTLFFLLFACLAHADTLIDPTRPVHAPTKSAATVRSVDPVARVTAIIKFGERRVAVLDGRVVKAGDRIGDVVIQEILADGVRFTRGGRVELARLQKQAAPVRSEVRKSSMMAGE